MYIHVCVCTHTSVSDNEFCVPVMYTVMYTLGDEE